jgi:hypothetical protein
MKILVILSFLLLSISFLAEHILPLQADVYEEMVQNDDTGKAAEEERENSKEAKEKNNCLIYNDLQAASLQKRYYPLTYPSRLSIGHFEKLFTPPDFL